MDPELEIVEDTSERETGASNDSGVSDAQLQANRQNAMRSTGPITEAGKQRSAQNALKHGIHASSTAIQDGVLAGDPAELAKYTGGIIDSLGPRDEVEYRVAERIADQFVRLDRAGRFEAASIAWCGGGGLESFGERGEKSSKARVGAR